MADVATFSFLPWVVVEQNRRLWSLARYGVNVTSIINPLYSNNSPYEDAPKETFNLLYLTYEL